MLILSKPRPFIGQHQTTAFNKILRALSITVASMAEEHRFQSSHGNRLLLSRNKSSVEIAQPNSENEKFSKWVEKKYK